MRVQALKWVVVTTLLALMVVRAPASKYVVIEEDDHSNLPPLSVAQGDDPQEAGSLKVDLEEAGSLKVDLEAQEMIDKTCDCYNEYQIDCFETMKMFGAFIIYGICTSGHTTGRRRKRARSDVEEDNFPATPPPFYRDNSCRSTSPIILSSSGTKERLTIGRAPYLLICRNSIGSKLKFLTVTGVEKVVVSTGALRTRTTNIVVTFSDIGQNLTIPEGAFSVQTGSAGGGGGGGLESDSGGFPPVEVELKVIGVPGLELKSRSIVAPRVALDVKQAQALVMGPDAVIPFANPDASGLTISDTANAVIESRAMTMGVLLITDTNKLLLKESALKVGPQYGGEASLEHIEFALFGSEALSLGPDVLLTINDVTIWEAGRRAIHNFNSSGGALTKVALTEVQGVGLERGAVCLVGRTAIIYQVLLKDGEGRPAGCIEARTLHGSLSEGSSNHAVVCSAPSTSDTLCGDDECRFCNPDLPETTPETTSVTLPLKTTLATTTEGTDGLPSASLLPATTTEEEILLTDASLHPAYYEHDYSYDTWENKTITSPPETATPFDFLGIPLYLLIIAVCTATILLLLVTYCLWSYYRSKREDKYRLPREGRETTFHNKAPAARAIATSEPIFTLGKPPHPAGTPPKDMYISFQFFKPPPGSSSEEPNVVQNGSGSPSHEQGPPVGPPSAEEIPDVMEEESFDGHERGHADGEEGVETAQPTGLCADDEPRPENEDSLLADQLPHERDNEPESHEVSEQTDLQEEEDADSLSSGEIESSSKF
ncbi:uncharacterized protein LOC125025752 [Penaeus chinensis]|uniref:uncharacterized protein LOC125025752 n=1 Tax=Penaeus chinensis TaxID=139456 RepID=UPI001FB6503D|nr:uncharacterized protein LOC125025752 [Penaeus chinensis]